MADAIPIYIYLEYTFAADIAHVLIVPGVFIIWIIYCETAQIM